MILTNTNLLRRETERLLTSSNNTDKKRQRVFEQQQKKKKGKEREKRKRLFSEYTVVVYEMRFVFMLKEQYFISIGTVITSTLLAWNYTIRHNHNIRE